MDILRRRGPWRYSLSQLVNSNPSASLKFRAVPHSSVIPHKQLYTSPSIPQYRSPSYCDPSTQDLILSELERHRHSKWGWVSYRTTYTPYSNPNWEHFKHLINCESRDFLLDSYGPDPNINKKADEALEWTFISDPSTLDGATIPELRTRFKDWTKVNFSLENPHATHSLQDHLNPRCAAMTPRYRFFIQVDEASLRSVIEAPRPDHCHTGEVNFVDAYWEPLPEDRTANEQWVDQGLEAIDGCTQEDVGWMKIASWMLSPDFYARIGDEEDWWRNYVRPPETCYVF
ncbi:hypothetical protein DL98DRAFT_519703 [Cadophora sp. DSE1049]|nr:hypothetical protein DL98DRAFT_519703 [Cadophora sp. DSE1049]